MRRSAPRTAERLNPCQYPTRSGLERLCSGTREQRLDDLQAARGLGVGLGDEHLASRGLAGLGVVEGGDQALGVDGAEGAEGLEQRRPLQRAALAGGAERVPR